MTHDQQIWFNMFYSISLELELENGKDSLHSSTSKASVFYQREHGKFKIENTNINKYKYNYSRFTKKSECETENNLKNQNKNGVK